MVRVAIVRDPGSAIATCELSFVERNPIDIRLADAQHRDYCHALVELGCRVVSLPAEPGLPDAVFVEDAAIVLDEIAILTRPGAASRRAEVPSIALALSGFRTTRWLEAPATLDGGDVLRIGRRIFVGQSARSNADGFLQLSRLAQAHGYTVESVPIRGCLHLKSSVTQISERTVLVNPDWVDVDCFSDFEIIAIDPTEEHAANVLRVGSTLLYPSSFPGTLERLQALGLEVRTVDVSELQKAEGAVTCCSLLFEVPA